MKLGDLIREYRDAHDYSQRQLANICGLSNGYISMLEKGFNPKTGKPITPTLPQFKKLADGMGMTMMDLLEKVDDMPIDLSSEIGALGDNVIPFDLASASTAAYVLRIAGRDGSYIERTLNDQQRAELIAFLNQMPDASDDL